MLQGNNRIEWPALRFPPINLWVMAALPQTAQPVTRRRPALHGRKACAENPVPPMSQRGPAHADVRAQLQRLLAMR